MKLRHWGYLILIILVGVSCSSAPILTPIRATATPIVITATPNSEQMWALLLPSETPTLTPTLTDTPYPTVQNIFYDTPVPPTSTPTSSPTPKDYPFVSLSLPAWTRNPDTPILLGLYQVLNGDRQYEYKNLALWNGRTGERYDFEIPDIVGYFWVGKMLGLVVKPMAVEPAIWLVDLASGAITKQALSEDVYAALSKDRYGGGAPIVYWPQEFGLSGDPGFSLGTFLEQVSPVLKDDRYRYENENWKITVFDVFNNESFSPTDPAKGLFDLWADWSPVAPYLAIFNSDVEVDVGMALTSAEPAKFTISIYDIPNRRLLKTFEDVVLEGWSPNGQYILAQPGAAYTWEGPPCILIFLSGKKYCFYDLLLSLKNTSAGTTSFFDLEWMPDSQGISFLYDTVESQDPLAHGGVCLLKVNNSRRQCFLESLPDAGPLPTDNEPLTVLDYWPDPGWQVMLFELARCGHWCDFSKSPHEFGFVDTNTGKIIILDGAPYSYDCLWRP